MESRSIWKDSKGKPSFKRLIGLISSILLIASVIHDWAVDVSGGSTITIVAGSVVIVCVGAIALERGKSPEELRKDLFEVIRKLEGDRAVTAREIARELVDRIVEEEFSNKIATQITAALSENTRVAIREIMAEDYKKEEVKPI